MPTTHSMLAMLRQAKATLLSDSQLLAQYLRHLDADAFRAIVERHGSMVHAVCQRGVRNEADVDDLFQATFLVLARNAQRIRQPDALAVWLHGTARRLVLQWQKQQYRTTVAALPDSSADPLSEASWHEVRQILDDELARLPQRLRSPLVLCYLEGLTGKEAADRLGISLRTLRRDLERGRLQLRENLARHGLTHLTLLAVVSTGSGLQALPPSTLINATVTQWTSWRAGLPLAASLQTLMKASGPSLLTPLFSLIVLTGFTTGLFFWANQAPPSHPPVATSTGPVTSRQPASRVDSYGDPLPEGILTRLGTVRFRHGSPVYAMAFSQDGKRLYTGSNDGTLRCSDFPSGKVLWSVLMPTVARNGFESVVALALSADNNTVAAAAMNDTVHLLNAHTGQFLMTMGKSNDRSSWMGFSTDGKSLYSLSNREPVTFRRYTLATGDTASEASLGDLFDAGASTRSIHVGSGQFQDRIAVGDQQNRIVIFNMLTGKIERYLTKQPAKVQDILWSEDGSYLLTSDETNMIRRLDAATGQVQWSDQVKSPARDIRLGLAGSGDNRRAIALTENEVRVYDAKSGLLQFKVAKSHYHYALAATSDGNTLAVAGSHGDLEFVDLTTGKPLASVPQSLVTRYLFWSDYSPDGKYLVTGGVWDPVMVWETATGKMTEQLDFRGKARFLDNQHLVAAGWNQGGLTTWQLKPLVKTRTFDESVLNSKAGIWSLDVSPDARNVIVTGEKRAKLPTLSTWEAETGKLVKSFDKVPGSPMRVIYSPNGKLIAINDFENQLSLFDASSGARVHQEPIPGGQGGAIAFSPDSQLLAWSTGSRQIRILHVPTFTTSVTIENRGDALDALTFSADGRSLLWGGQHWPTVYVFDPRTGQERVQWRKHLGPITHLRFAPDGHSFTSTSQDGTVLLWDWHQYQARRGMADEPLAEKEREALFKDLLGSDASRSWNALERLLRSPRQSLAWVEKHLSKVPAVDNKQLQEWIKELASSSFEVRNRASRQLQAYLEHAVPLLKQAVQSQPSAELKIRLTHLLDEYQRTYVLKDRIGELLDSLDSTQAQQLKEALPGCKLRLD